MVCYKVTHKNFPQVLTEITESLTKENLFRDEWPDNLQNKKHVHQSLTLGSVDDEYVAVLNTIKESIFRGVQKKSTYLRYECQTAASINI